MYGVRLAWSDLPTRLHDWVGGVLGAPVVSASSQPAGFSPGSADRVVTADGRRGFVKAVSPEQNPDTPGLHRREIAVLRTLADVRSVPRLIDAYDDGEWVALVIEDVEGRHPLPWTHETVAATVAALAELARVGAPASWPALEEELVGEMAAWSRLREDPPADLDPWLGERIAELDALCARTLPRMAGGAVAHTDVRADNLLVDETGTVRLVDWPWASRGAAWCDAVMLLLNIRWAGDLDVRPHLAAVEALGASREDVLGLLAGLTGFCTEACRRPAAPGLPTLRAFQREQAVAGRKLLEELGL
ncbi:aminoglycoside phosphotransferase family protein [Ornithinimicrobium panacihumi]|uniref:aminoglycoside phosphotransferase family protein n=1 Tax=Ornithinimicrobium panacihumi TaxID=2008449 RepID=UPI003F896484